MPLVYPTTLCCNSPKDRPLLPHLCSGVKTTSCCGNRVDNCPHCENIQCSLALAKICIMQRALQDYGPNPLQKTNHKRYNHSHNVFRQKQGGQNGGKKSNHCACGAEWCCAACTSLPQHDACRPVGYGVARRVYWLGRVW